MKVLLIQRRTLTAPPVVLLLALLASGMLNGQAGAQSGGRPGGGGPGLPPGAGGPLLGSERPQFRPGLSESATDEIVTAIRVEGNQTIPASRVTNEMQTRVGRNYDPRALANDVRKLAALPWFIDVKPLSERTPEGRVIILRVVERPVVRYVEYLGNVKVKDKKLAEETGIDIGSAVDPFVAEEGRRKIEELYIAQGYPRAQVSLLEGDQADDVGVVYVINEGVQQRIASVSFEGNDPEFATARRLKTRIQSKPGWLLGTFGGRLNREQLDADVRALTDYYRQFGFYMARVGRVLEFDEQGEWVDIRFVINEGPRYFVRNVQFIGNEKFSIESLRSGLTLLEEAPFERAKLLVDQDWIKQLYGSQGYVFADVRAEPILLEQPGQVDLVYHIEEGDAWRVGRIFVHIDGDNPHTRIQTALNRLSLRPGDIMDIRELRASERRIQASQLFLSDPASGARPKITYRIPELGDTEFTADSGGSGSRAPSRSASRPSRPAPPPGGSGYRGQSPEPPKPGWRLREIRGRLWNTRKPASVRDDSVDVYLDFNAGVNARLFELTPAELKPAPGAAQRHTVYRPPVPSAFDPYATTPAARPARRVWGRSANNSAYQQFAHTPVAQTSAARQFVARPQYRGQSPQPGAAFAPPAAPPASQSLFTAPQGIQPGGQVVPTQFGFPRPTTSPGAPATGVVGAPNVNPNLDPTVLPLQPADGGGQLFPDGRFGPLGAPYPDRAVDLIVNVAEGQTGRFTLGVGVNSDAGVIGNIVLDERNFDIRRWPGNGRSFANGTAFRGAGQRFRLEAAPGSQVQRYLASFTEPYLFDTPISFSLSGSLFDRRFEDYDEQRLGGRISLGYQWVENDLSASLTYRGESVRITDPSVGPGVVPELDEVVDRTSDLHGFGVRIANDTRNSPFLPTQGHFVELQLEQVVGTFDYPRAIIDARKYFLLSERPDHSGRHVLQTSTRLGFTGSNTPIFEHFFAGGFSTLRGFDFRGASPVDTGVEVGGEFLWINSVEYLFPITADDTISGVVFCDFGTVERNVTVEDFRVAPGVGLRLQVPAFGPAPIALDFAFALNEADTDDTQVFTFNIGFLR